ncbi:hypothetical protein [Planctomycetes bacterium TBK1r]|uniref:hypothetical protein n=1 Tax=Stieleria magnilauensis TaxID=2527963 RepID=UPI0011A55FA9
MDPVVPGVFVWHGWSKLSAFHAGDLWEAAQWIAFGGGDAWMALEIEPGALDGVEGTVEYSQPFMMLGESDENPL